ncbi:Pirin domain protein [Thalassoporum mexicanum PCC 7367]|uniref:pirin family protein n=1 Tax=Thalassoporum mexicanum TaxID=3457544 RepID=UPI0002A00115|nr:pirin family protein [Pseudanabaena sp. PCC 7367]AFY69200.1 Pirin domain protein [Pseudanabaena sp. PCC 7367]
MTVAIRKSAERGHANHGWLDSYHTFSFANYMDPAHMGFRDLRVINQDRVKGGMGFGAHGHRDMEIVTYVLDGALEHKDSMGNGEVMQPGDVQRMSAGTGIVHSEYNASITDPVHFLQIWIYPQDRGIKPGYVQKGFSRADKLNQLRLIVSPDGRDNSLTINQNTSIYASVLEPGAKVMHTVKPDRHAWVQIARGSATLNGQPLREGDGVAVSEAGDLEIAGQDEVEFLIFDLA